LLDADAAVVFRLFLMPAFAARRLYLILMSRFRRYKWQRDRWLRAYAHAAALCRHFSIFHDILRCRRRALLLRDRYTNTDVTSSLFAMLMPRYAIRYVC